MSPTVVLAAVSGGADSTFMLHMLHKALQHTDCALHVCHVDHRTKMDSGADVEFVKSLAARLEIPFHPVELPASNEKLHSNRQARWRQDRYRLLTEVVLRLTEPGECSVVATGHHVGDQVETLLMNLLRGTHLAGLCGMKEWSLSEIHQQARPQDPGYVLIWRPLLACVPEDIRNCLKTWKEPWLEDKSNQDESHTRNRIRHHLIPQLSALRPDSLGFLAKQMESWRSDFQAIECIHEQNLNRALVSLSARASPSPKAAVVFHLDTFRHLPTWQQRGMLVQVVSRLGRNRHLTSARLNEMCRQLQPAARSCGPHTWFGDVCWSVWHKPPAGVVGLETDNDLLTFHLRDTEPFLLDIPRWPWAWDERNIPLTANNELELPGWTFFLSRCSDPGKTENSFEDRNPWDIYLDLAEIELNTTHLVLKPVDSRLKIQPSGMPFGTKSVGHILRDNHIHSTLRTHWPAVYTDSGKPIWICGLRMAAPFAPKAPDRFTLRLHWQRNS